MTRTRKRTNSIRIPQSEEKLTVLRVSYSSPVFQRLVAEMYADLTPLYGGTPSGTFPPLDFNQPGSVFVVGFLKGKGVACGAVLPFTGDCGEIKRMFVEPARRGRGYSRDILVFLENHARQAGFRTLQLETGIKQPVAIHLYETAGYHQIENFGKYAGDPTSLCFEKDLASE